jgi:hypothetical protein
MAQPPSDDLQLLFKTLGVTISSLLAGGALGATSAARQLDEINESIRSVADGGPTPTSAWKTSRPR